MDLNGIHAVTYVVATLLCGLIWLMGWLAGKVRATAKDEAGKVEAAAKAEAVKVENLAERLTAHLKAETKALLQAHDENPRAHRGLWVDWDACSKMTEKKLARIDAMVDAMGEVKERMTAVETKLGDLSQDIRNGRVKP